MTSFIDANHDAKPPVKTKDCVDVWVFEMNELIRYRNARQVVFCGGGNAIGVAKQEVVLLLFSLAELD